jgi:hypothetical protein
MKLKLMLVSTFSLIGLYLFGQQLTQTVRGSITDKITGEPLIGAVVVLKDSDPAIGTATDVDGVFKLQSVPVGRITLYAQMLGYKPVSLQDVLVNSGKELVLQIAMEEDLNQIAEVNVTDEKDKRESINSMAGVSSRTFSVEETQKFAAAVNDPGRMAISFAGVVSGDDGNNMISIRGNSPYGLLWKMEGVDIPNPNHYSNAASSGGGISILSAQLLGNSEFFTGAFPAEYGNALSGVFDLRLRKGNNEKREFTFQAGLLGLDIAAEGPIKKGYNGSYLINYRYSTLSVLGKIGVPLGDAITNFQDLSFNVYLPSSNIGNFQIYGFGGLSSQWEDAKRDTSKWEYYWQQYDRRFQSNTMATGVRHIIPLNENAYLQSSVVLSGNLIAYHQDKVAYDFELNRDYEERYDNGRMMLTSVLNYKFNRKSSLRAGSYFSLNNFSLLQRILNQGESQLEDKLNMDGHNSTIQAFASWKYRASERLAIVNGLHILYLPMNKTRSIEPRISARYQLDETKTVTLGYGLHGQVQPIGIYKAQVLQADGTIRRPNENLGMNKSHHLVVGYEHALSRYVFLKTEVYYQYLFNIAIAADTTSLLSSLNNAENYITEALVNNGKGRNYGVELTLEHYMHNNMYFLLSGSLYNSEFLVHDKVWRSTRFNAGYAATFTAGKEWPVGKVAKNKVLGVNIRTIYRGGLRSTPINIEESVAQETTIYNEAELYTLQVPYYFRSDLRLSLRRNRPHATTTLALDIQIVSNRKNVWGEYFDSATGTVTTSYQTPLIPIISYKVEF